MIITKISLKIKNIIFFKIVSLTILISVISYYISYSLIVNADLKAKLLQSKNTLSNSYERLNVLKNKGDEMEDIISQYNELILSKDDPNDCFNRSSYEKSLRKIEKNFKLNHQIKLYSSSNSSYRKDQNARSILLRTTAIKLIYHVDDFSSSIAIAKSAFNELPPYNYVRSYEIKRNEILSPSLINWLSNSNTPDMVSNTMLMEVKELDLNEY